jgi:hypothetical protein
MPRRSGNARRRTSRDSRRSGASRSSRTRRTSRSAVRRRRFRAEDQKTALVSPFTDMSDREMSKRLDQLFDKLNKNVKLDILDKLLELNLGRFTDMSDSEMRKRLDQLFDKLNKNVKYDILDKLLELNIDRFVEIALRAYHSPTNQTIMDKNIQRRAGMTRKALDHSTEMKENHLVWDEDYEGIGWPILYDTGKYYELVGTTTIGPRVERRVYSIVP